MGSFETEYSALPEDQNRDVEKIWLESHEAILWPMADFHFGMVGRGAIIIITSMEAALSGSIGEAVQLHYAEQAEIEQEEDEVSQQLAGFVRTYDPDREFVVAFISPDLEISMYQLGVEEELIQAVQAANLAEGQIDRIGTGIDLEAAKQLHKQFDTAYQKLLRELDLDQRV